MDYSVLGAATSGVMLARGMGGSLGTAVFGAIFTSRLHDSLSGVSAAGAGGLLSHAARLTGHEISRLPPPARHTYQHAYVHALRPVFLVAAGMAALGFALAWLLEERPLRATAATSRGLEDSLAAPKSPDSLAEIERALSVQTSRENRLRFHERLADRAAVALSPGGTWALVRIHEHGFAGARRMAEEQGVAPERIAAVFEELRAQAMVAGDDGTQHLAAAGRDATRRVVAARRALLEEVLADEAADRDPAVQALLRRLARELAGDPP